MTETVITLGATQKAGMQAITLNSIGSGPAMQPGLNNHGSVRYANRLKGVDAGIQIDDFIKVKFIRGKHIN